jgi:hypothetical protein
VTIAADNMDLATSFCDNEAGADARLRHAVHEAIAILRHGRRHGDPTALDEAARVMEKRRPPGRTPPRPPAGGAPVTTTTLLMGLAFVGGAVVAWVLANDSDDDRTAR